jgi:hypothetical protein
MLFRANSTIILDIIIDFVPILLIAVPTMFSFSGFSPLRLILRDPLLRLPLPRVIMIPTGLLMSSGSASNLIPIPIMLPCVHINEDWEVIE